MAESLAALGVAANIAQFIELGIKAVSVITQVYQSSDGLTSDNREFALVANDLKQHLPTILGDVAVPSDPQLKNLLSDCIEIATALEGEIKSITAPEGGARSLSKLLLSARAFTKRSRIEELHQRMLRMRDQVSFRLDALLRSRERELASKVDNLSVVSRGWNSDLVKRIDAISTDLHRLLNSDPKDLAQEQAFRTLVELVTGYVSESKTRDRLQALLQPLYFPQIRERQSNIPTAYAETFSWVLDQDTTPLPRWLSNDSGIFWISGKPGSGKSTLMKFLVGHPQIRHSLENWADGKPILTPSCFLWSAGTEIQRSLRGLLRSLIFHILVKVPNLAAIICPERWHDPNLQEFDEWSTDELARGIHRLATTKELPVKICVFIDALDELDGDLDDVMSALLPLRESLNVKLCVSSRPWVIFADAFGECPQLRIHDFTRADIEAFVKGNLEGNSHFRRLQQEHPADANGLVLDLTQRSAGVFLWVFLSVKSILRGFRNYDSLNDLRRRLDEIPDDLENFFKVMVNRIESQYWEECAILFKCLVVMRRPLPIIAFWAMDAERSGLTRKWSFAPAKGEQLSPEAHHLAVKARREFSPDSARESDIALKGRQFEARCKDIVRIIRQADCPAPGNMMIEFLHRTVADFFSSSELSHLIDSHLPKDFDVKLVLAKSMIEVVRQRLLSEPRRYDQQLCEWILWALYLVLNLEGQARGEQLHLLDDLSRSLDGMDWSFIFRHLQGSASAELRGESFATLIPRLGYAWYIAPTDSQTRKVRVARCLLSALKPVIELRLHDNITYALSECTDLDMVHKMLAYEEADAALQDPQHYALWPSYLGYLLERRQSRQPGGPQNAFDVVRILIAHGAPRMVYVTRFLLQSITLKSELIDEAGYDEEQINLNEGQTELVDAAVILQAIFSEKEHEELLNLFPKPEHDATQTQTCLAMATAIPPWRILSIPGAVGAILGSVLAILVRQFLS